MDSELRTRISGVVLLLAEQEQKRLRAAGTFIELEELACQIGDEVTCQLMTIQLSERCNEAAEASTEICPDCGRLGSQSDPEHRQLTSIRGELSYHEPAYYCHSCRRSFFPGGGQHGFANACDSDAKVGAEDGLGGEQSG